MSEDSRSLIGFVEWFDAVMLRWQSVFCLVLHEVFASVFALKRRQQEIDYAKTNSICKFFSFFQQHERAKLLTGFKSDYDNLIVAAGRLHNMPLNMSRCYGWLETRRAPAQFPITSNLSSLICKYSVVLFIHFITPNLTDVF